MKAPLVIVAASLTAAIILTASLLIATGTHGASATSEPGHILRVSPPGAVTVHDHLWKMKKAPSAMKAKPSA